MIYDTLEKHNTGRKYGVLQVLPALMSGGVEREVIEIAQAAEKNGFRSFVASSGGPMVGQLYGCGARHFELPLHSKNPIIMFKNIAKLAQIIDKHEIDIVHAQSRAPAWSAYFAAKKMKKPFITTIHGAHSVNNKIKTYYNSIMTKGEKIIAVSYYIADYIRENYKIDEHKIEVIHCGTNLDNFNYNKIEKSRLIYLIEKMRIPTDKSIIMLPGRIVRSKGHRFLIEALRDIPKNLYNCILVGDDKGHLKYREELQRLIDIYDLTKNIIITSHVNDMAAMYALSDIVVSVSTKPEAFGLIAIEAQAMGRMVIATDIGGSRETIINNKTGWLIPPNDIRALTKAIKDALSLDTPTRLYKAKLARDHVENHFSLDKMCDKVLNLYTSILR